jgi:erythrin-vacuolar iron transport family protein
MPRSFASLTPSEALQVAISIEQRNAEIYHRFAEMFTEFGDAESLEIASVFWEMAIEERGHRALLDEKYAQAYGSLTLPFLEDELAELIEVPKVDCAELLSDKDGLTARERALQVALQAEISAQEFYERLAAQTPPGTLRQVYDELAKMEDGHVAFLESKLVSTSAGTPTIQ